MPDPSVGLSVCRPGAKIPVERLCAGDPVQAVEFGPKGRVVDADRRGWTIVEYGPGKTMPYEHGRDRLFLLEASHV